MPTKKALTVAQLKAQVAKITKENLVKIRQASEVARLTATIALESSPALFDAKVSLNVNTEQTKVLQNLIKQCETTIEDMPVVNKSTRKNRVWAGNHRYAFGTQVDLMYELASGILYSCKEHKEMLLALTGLNAELLEQFVNAMGSPSYYSLTYNTIVEQKPAELSLALAILNVMQSELGVVINTDKLNKNNLESEFVRAETQAKNKFAQAVEAIDTAQLQL